jgi:hypothetical protein
MDKFSKWNKRIISYILIGVGIYMGILKYELLYVLTFLGSGLINIGMAIWQSVKKVKMGDLPPKDKEQK